MRARAAAPRGEASRAKAATPSRREPTEGAAADLVAWYRRHGRDLPWRRRPDPYRILVSEMMLQQTTVETVIPYYERFLAAWPDAASLAAASEEEVLRAWSGLGYYRRARSLRAAAREIVGKHAGAVPSDPAALRALPGIGPYSAAAIAAIAHDRPEVALDGNLRRVLARLIGRRGPARGAAADRDLRRAGEALVAAAPPSEVNQALMDLGATLCSPRAPRCLLCPLEARCAARRLGAQEEIPAAGRRPATTEVRLAAFVLESRGRWLLRLRRGRLMGGLWDVPLVPARAGEGGVVQPGQILAKAGLQAGPLRAVGQIRHAITTHRIRVAVYAGSVTPRGAIRRGASLADPPASGRGARASAGVAELMAGGPWMEGSRWIPRARAAELPLTGIARKILDMVGGVKAGSARASEPGRPAPRPRGGSALRPGGSGRRSSVP